MPTKLIIRKSVTPAVVIFTPSVVVDAERHEVFLNGHALPVPPKEYAILVALLDVKGATMSRERLLAVAWKGDTLDIDTRTVDQHIARLRRRLGKLGEAIVTVTGRGYRATNDIAYKVAPITPDNSCKVVSIKRIFGTYPRAQVTVEFNSPQATLVPGSTLRLEQVR